MKEKGKKSHNYIFTVNNYTEVDLKKFHKLAEKLKKHNYICYGLEIAPETKTKHIQGYIQLLNNQRFTFLHNYFNFKRNKKILKFHIEPAMGTAIQNKKYTEKEGYFFEFGEPKKQGDRTDIIKIKESLKENPRELERIVKEDVANYQQLRFAEKFTDYCFKNRSTENPPKVFWIYGSTGIGKTSLIYKKFTDICSVSSCDWIGTDYKQNECLLFDDFRESDLKFNILLKITDRFPINIFYKGGSIPLNSPFIIFTTSKSIENTFSHTRKYEDLAQLKRRIQEVDLDSKDVDIDKLFEKKEKNDNLKK